MILLNFKYFTCNQRVSYIIVTQIEFLKITPSTYCYAICKQNLLDLPYIKYNGVFKINTYSIVYTTVPKF